MSPRSRSTRPATTSSACWRTTGSMRFGSARRRRRSTRSPRTSGRATPPRTGVGEVLQLAGVKVVEFCQVLAGPYCGMLLADLGAEVIKVEPPDGDMMRQWPPITEGPGGGFSENFASINRNKRSVVLDLKDPKHKEAARKLVLSADVLLENNRPGVMERLGLGYDSFRQEKPGLVYCSISAFGQTGPRAKDGGFDVT